MPASLSPTWRAFLADHVEDRASIDFFIVPRLRFEILFVFLVLAHHLRVKLAATPVVSARHRLVSGRNAPAPPAGLRVP